MTIQIPGDDLSNLKIFFESSDVENFFARPASQQLKKEFVYFARYGKSFDGHKFALQIIRSKNFIVAEKNNIVKIFTDAQIQHEIFESEYFIPVAHVESVLTQEMKKFALINDLNFKSVGVTGTSGKTSVVQLTGQILSSFEKIMKIGTLGIEIYSSEMKMQQGASERRVYKREAHTQATSNAAASSFPMSIDGAPLPNSHLTTPDYPTFINALVQAKKAGVRTLIMEVSSHGLAQSRLADYQFDVAVFTNFSQDHLDFHHSMQEYLEAKTLLFSKHLKLNGTCIVSTQSPEWMHIVRNCTGAERTLYLVLHDNDEDVFAHMQNHEENFKNIYFLKIDGKKSTFDGLSGEFNLLDRNRNSIACNRFTTPLIGETNFENIMNAYCICTSLGYSSAEFVTLFPHLKGIAGRMERVGAQQRRVVEDILCTSAICARRDERRVHDAVGGTQAIEQRRANPAGAQDKPCVIVDYSHKPGALELVLKTLRSLLPQGKKLITVFGCGGDRDASKRPAMGHVASKLSDIVIITSDNPRTEDPNKIIDQILSGVTKSSTYLVESDRRLAIQMAFKIAKKSDIILIAGKGHETYQIIGNQKIEFSDVKVAEEFLMDASEKE